jgi:hypothetical protein
MKRSLVLFSVVVSLLVLAGCFTSGTKAGPLSVRAAYDMQCPEKDLQITELGGKTFGVRGCDKQATYTEVCAPKPGSFTGDCAWTQSASPPK